MIEINGLNIVLKKLENLADLNTDALLNKIGQKAKNEIALSFENERDAFSGAKWASLKPSTLKRKARKKISLKPLHGETGRLSDIYMWSVSVSGNSVIISNNAGAHKSGFKYGLSHQFGAPKRNIHARPFLPVKSGELSPKMKKFIKS